MTQLSLIAVGGTIASLTAGGAPMPCLSGAELVDSARQGGTGAVAVSIRTETYRNLPSSAVTFGDVIALADLVRSHLAEGSEGVVVTHGTDTLEEVAFALDLLLDTPAPVVVTGAMRHPGLLSPDGPANVAAALEVAAAPTARDLGVLVVMNEVIHAARFVQKSHTSNLAAFQSRWAGPLGSLSEGIVAIPLRIPRLATVPVPAGIEPTHVLTVTTALDDRGIWLELLADDRVGGGVVEGLGGGHVPPWLTEALGELAACKPVVLTSRTGAGPNLTRTYDMAGSEIDLARRGLISGGWLDGPKARVLLTLLLADGRSLPDIRAGFATVLGSDA